MSELQMGYFVVCAGSLLECFSRQIISKECFEAKKSSR